MAIELHLHTIFIEKLEINFKLYVYKQKANWNISDLLRPPEKFDHCYIGSKQVSEIYFQCKKQILIFHLSGKPRWEKKGKEGWS